LKAGGAYVPLDPEYPQARLAYMVEDANLDIVLTQSDLQDKTQIARERAVYLDEVDTLEKINSLPRKHLSSIDLRLTSSHLAYVIYTSGSTGQPKGVMIQHSNTSALHQWAKETYTPEELRVVAAGTSVCFDLSVFEILISLQLGASVWILNNILDLVDSDSEIKNSVTLMNTVPSAIAELLGAGAIPKSVQVVNLAGELLNQELVESLYESGIPKVFDLYGPSEDTTYSTYEHREPGKYPCIGRPIINTQAFILDSWCKPVMLGVLGELHLSGAGLSRGYLNRPELTLEKFIRNPYSDNPNDRLYKTGDLCRYLPDGNIEYVGRIDHQVKIRGFRIELGEIESVLSKYQSIEDAVVLAKTSQSNPDDQYLVAYIRSREALNATQLRDYLQVHLPHYMIPSAFTVLSEFPLTPNGKVDRQALLSMAVDRVDSGKTYSAPTSGIEKALVEIWSEALHLPEKEIGIEHDFFALGGHSLLATQVVSKVRQRLQKEMPLRAMFETPTIKALGVLVEQKKIEHAYPPLIHIENRQNLPLSFAQERLWFLDQLDSGSDTYHVPCVYRLRGHLNCEALEKALHTLLLRHESLRTNFQTDDKGRPFQIIHAQSKAKLDFRDVSSIEDGAEKQRQYDLYSKEWVNTPFNLSQDSLVRLGLIRRDANDHTLILVFHHIVTDGWSMGILEQELSELYAAYSEGKENPLLPLSIQYADYAVWHRDWLAGERLEKETAYWQSQLKGTALLEFPADRVRPPVPSYRGDWVRLTLESEVASSLRQLAQDEGCTLFMTLLSVFNVLLYRYSQQNDICIGTPIANRLQSEVELIVGFFVNTLGIRSVIDSKGTFKQLLHSVKETTLDAYEHQSLPFEQVVEVVNPERSQSYSPLFQVMFTLQNTQEGELDLPKIKIEQEGVASWNVSKFDLSLSLQEYPDGSIVGGIVYATDLFDSETAERFKTHFIELSKAIVAAPEKALYELEFLTSKEKHQSLVEWGDTAAPYTYDRCIHELFEAQVKKSPDATAVIFEDQELTYQELNEKANQLAHYLVEKGVKPDTLVGICVERSLAIVIGLLGILKAGGAYVLLAPEDTDELLDYMQNDSGLKFILTEKDLGSSKGFSASLVICVDECDTDDEIKRHPKNDLNYSLVRKKSKLASAIYIYGPEYYPILVESSHYSFVVTLNRNISSLNLNQNSSLLLLTPTLSEATYSEIFLAFCSGAKVVLPNFVSRKYVVESYKPRVKASHVFVDEKFHYISWVKRFCETYTDGQIVLAGFVGFVTGNDFFHNIRCGTYAMRVPGILGFYGVSSVFDGVVSNVENIKGLVRICNDDSKDCPIGVYGNITLVREDGNYSCVRIQSKDSNSILGKWTAGGGISLVRLGIVGGRRVDFNEVDRIVRSLGVGDCRVTLKNIIADGSVLVIKIYVAEGSKDIGDSAI
ncbi:MAG: amino acid adenylation domain-containing protein, partial [Gammaproteobacteria bacterium]